MGDDNLLLEDADYLYENDAEGNRTKRTDKVSGDYVTYTWDHRHRLTAVAFFDDEDVLQKKVEYDYDLYDRRIARRVDADGDDVFDSAERFVYDGEDIVLVFDDSGSLTSRYLHGPGIDEIFADERFVGGLREETYWALPDNQGSVRDLAVYDALLEETEIAKHVEFNSFGEITGDTAPALAFLYSYTGREWDPVAELFYYRARWYDPKAMRFLSKDPIGFDAGDANEQRYVGNDAVNLTDPSGLAPDSPLPHDHHHFVREFTETFEEYLKSSKDKDFDIDDFAQKADRRLVHGAVAGTELADELKEAGEELSKGGKANNLWKRLFSSDAFKNAPKCERGKMILEHMMRTAKEDGLDLSDMSKYGDPKTVEKNAESLAKFLKLLHAHGVHDKEFEDQIGKMAKRLVQSPAGKELLKKELKHLSFAAVKKYGKAALGWVGWVITAATMTEATVNRGGKTAIAEELGVPPELIDALLAGQLSLNPKVFRSPIEGNVTLQDGSSICSGSTSVKAYDRERNFMGWSSIWRIYQGAEPGTYDVWLSDRSGQGVLVRGVESRIVGMPETFRPEREPEDVILRWRTFDTPEMAAPPKITLDRSQLNK